MTTVLKQTTTDNGYYIYAEVNQSGIVTVAACPMINEDLAGYPEAECTYRIDRIDAALRTYRRYVKKFGGQ
jgi:hypothetical protein